MEQENWDGKSRITIILLSNCLKQNKAEKVLQKYKMSYSATLFAQMQVKLKFL